MGPPPSVPLNRSRLVLSNDDSAEQVLSTSHASLRRFSSCKLSRKRRICCEAGSDRGTRDSSSEDTVIAAS